MFGVNCWLNAPSVEAMSNLPLKLGVFLPEKLLKLVKNPKL